MIDILTLSMWIDLLIPFSLSLSIFIALNIITNRIEK